MFTVSKDWKKQLILVTALLFPVLCASVEHAGSIIFTILLLMSLAYGWQGWGQLVKDERQFFISLLILFSFIALGLFYTVDVKEGLSKLERYLRILLLVPVYLMIRRFDLKVGNFFAYGTLLAVPVLMLQGIYQIVILDRPVASGAYHKIVFGDMVILFTSISIAAVLIFAKKKQHQLLSIALVISGVYSVIMSNSRAALLFIPLLALFLLVLFSKKITRNAWKVIGIITVISLFLIVFVQPNRVTSGLKVGIDNFRLYQQDPSEWSSWGARLNFWRNSLIMFSESPVLGKGTGAYQTENIALVEKGISHADYVVNFGHAHSIYFHTLAENGLIGVVVLVIALIILPFRYFYRRWKVSKNPEQSFYTLAGMICIVAFAWFGMSEMWLARNPFVNVYFMCMLVFMSSTASVFSGDNIEQNKA